MTHSDFLEQDFFKHHGLEQDGRFNVHDQYLPLERNQAWNAGWCAFTDFRPVGVTWHWTATWDLETCDRLLGGACPERRGQASAHYGVGRSFDEGVSRYVSLEDRSWHAGKNQLLRWDGNPKIHADEKGARTTVGVETVNIGYARSGVEPEEDWIAADDLEGETRMLVQPWTDEQIEMMIAVGREIVTRWPHMGPRDHHGHHDLCPGYKVDVAGFPFARVLRGIYDDPSLPDPWSDTWTASGRRRALERLGYLPSSRIHDDRWYRLDDLALRRFQQDHGLVVNGWWTTAVAWAVHDAIADSTSEESAPTGRE